MKTVTNKTLYICDGCKKRYLRKSACEEHEKVCPRVVGNIPQCTTCAHFGKEPAVYDDPYTSGMVTTHFDVFLCKSYNEYLLSKSGAKNGLLAHICSMPMPTDSDKPCEFKEPC